MPQRSACLFPRFKRLHLAHFKRTSIITWTYSAAEPENDLDGIHLLVVTKEPCRVEDIGVWVYIFITTHCPYPITSFGSDADPSKKLHCLPYIRNNVRVFVDEVSIEVIILCHLVRYPWAKKISLSHNCTLPTHPRVRRDPNALFP
jgi:hypothetical protein